MIINTIINTRSGKEYIEKSELVDYLFKLLEDGSYDSKTILAIIKSINNLKDVE